jgi:hypothetical protein
VNPIRELEASEQIVFPYLTRFLVVFTAHALASFTAQDAILVALTVLFLTSRTFAIASANMLRRFLSPFHFGLFDLPSESLWPLLQLL